MRAWLFLRGNIGNPTACLKDHALRVEVKAAFRMLRDALPGLRSTVEDKLLRLTDQNEEKVLWPDAFAALPSWLQRVDAFVQQAKRHMVKVLADDVEKYAQGVAKATPKVEHFVSDKVYLKPLAKKNLIEWRGRDAHSKETVALYGHMAGLASTHKELEVHESLDELAHDTKQYCEAIFNDAKRVITITAHVNAIQCLTGKEQSETVSALIAAGHDIPGALRDELKKLAAKLGQKHAAGHGKRKA